MTEADSLLHLIKSCPKEDTVKVNHILNYHKYIYPSNPDTAYLLSLEAIRISVKLGYSKGIVRAMSNKAIALWYKNDDQKAVFAFHKAFQSADR